MEKKCPYCGRRISYFTVFHEKKHGLYKCTRCKKESKIKTDMKLLAAFGVVALSIVIFLIVWNTNESLHNNLLSVPITAAVLLIFYFCTPLFVRFIPLKKYIEEKEENIYSVPIDTGESEYKFDRAAFDEIKKRRNEKRKTIEDDKDSDKLVPIIKDVSASHVSSDAPLKKVAKPVKKEIPVPEEEEVKTYVPKSKRTEKPDGSTYTANRKL